MSDDPIDPFADLEPERSSANSADDQITLQAFSEMVGVTPMAISKAVKAGRLDPYVVRHANGRAMGIRNPAEAKEYLAANADPTRGPSAGNPEFQDAKAEKEYWQARHAELDFKEAAKELIPASELKRTLVNTFAACRTKLMGIPTRVRQQDPSFTTAQLTTLEAVLREALEDLAGDPREPRE